MEIYNINEKNWLDYTGQGPWNLNGETYNFIGDYPSDECDSECHNVIVERESDGKHFKFEWFYDNGHYYFENELVEVNPEMVISEIYE